jgi:hypothetical protein
MQISDAKWLEIQNALADASRLLEEKDKIIESQRQTIEELTVAATSAGHGLLKYMTTPNAPSHATGGQNVQREGFDRTVDRSIPQLDRERP